MDNEEIFETWKVDCQIKKTSLDDESVEIPKLHEKWLRVLSSERVILRGMERRGKKYRHALSQFYLYGSNEASKKMGWTLPPQGKVLKTEVASYVDDHPEMVKISDEIANQTEKVEVLSEILKQINKRNYYIRDAIDDRRFKQGS